jgi:hypothetical protein
MLYFIVRVDKLCTFAYLYEGEQEEEEKKKKKKKKKNKDVCVATAILGAHNHNKIRLTTEVYFHCQPQSLIPGKTVPKFPENFQRNSN